MMDTERTGLTTADIASSSTNAAGADPDFVDDRNIDGDAKTADGRGAMASDVDTSTEPLFAGEDATRYRSEWTTVQGEFVDDPRNAVERADQLVANLMQSLAEQFAETRSRLEQQWTANEDVSTEDLRLALMRYRSFFERLLSA